MVVRERDLLRLRRSLLTYANWLVGKGEHLELKAESKTVRLVNQVENRAPFPTLIKYRVDYDKS